MTHDELISMAHEAGTIFVTRQGIASATPEWLERFAQLVAAHAQPVIASEWVRLTDSEIQTIVCAAGTGWTRADVPTVRILIAAFIAKQGKT